LTDKFVKLRKHSYDSDTRSGQIEKFERVELNVPNVSLALQAYNSPPAMWALLGLLFLLAAISVL